MGENRGKKASPFSRKEEEVIPGRSFGYVMQKGSAER